METIYLLTAFFLGTLFGAAALYFIRKSATVSREFYNEANHQLIRAQAELHSANQKSEELNQLLIAEKKQLQQQNDRLSDLNNEFIKTSAENTTLLSQIQEQKNTLQQQLAQIELLHEEKQQIFLKNAEISAINTSLQESLQTQKEEILNIRNESRLQFENLANRILEEKTAKFTTTNQVNLKNLLEPFQEKMLDLKNLVNEAYEKENKERFSLTEKVKELAELNLQISEDAKKLTKALKGESKTQGMWGEMILESILEKSGLVKGREYFLEHELRDDQNRALFSAYSGKKMRPDAVIKYPDHRNVIIDSKVSLKDFVALTDETDPEIYRHHLNRHLASVKTHIRELSDKSYDDYGNSADFVMMFIPSEPAYIAAMQADPHLWNFAYEKRILLLSPGNLITSLKLIADLWKREYQNRNTLEIAERGAKLYDKFVGFVENLEKIGKNIDQTQSYFREAYKQLSTGNDNLVLQTQKLKELGIKSKKELPAGLINQAQNKET